MTMFNHSCEQCRSSKLRCDGSTPCSTCQNKGTTESCLPVVRKIRINRRTSNAGISHPISNQEDVSATFTTTSAATSASLDRVNLDSEMPCDDTLLFLAREALGDLSVCEDLIKNVFYWKVSSAAYGSVHLPTILTLLGDIFDTSSARVDNDDLTLCMMVTALGLQYMTKQWSPANLINRIEAMSSDMGPRGRQQLLWELSLKYTQHRMVNGEATFAQIQTIMLLLIFDQDDDKTREQIFDHAVRSAQRLGMHHLDIHITGDLQQEVMVRAWWFLVCHSWFSSLYLSTYSILPSHFSTRLPVQVDDFDKQPKVSILTNSSYQPVQCSFSMIELAHMVRRLVDLRLEDRVDFKDTVEDEFNRLSQRLPPQYTFDSIIEVIQSGPHQIAGSGRPTVEKWILHQQIFHAYLEFQRFECHQPVTFSCRFLANHILDIQQQISTYCCVINNLRVNVTNVVKAAFVLIYDLMQSPAQNHMTRSVTIGKIRNALQRCKTTKATTKVDFDAVLYMLKMEEEKWSQSRESVRQHSHSPATPSPGALFFEDLNSCTSTSAYFAVPAWDVEDCSMLPSDGGLFPLLRSDSDEQGTNWQQLYQSLFS